MASNSEWSTEPSYGYDVYPETGDVKIGAQAVRKILSPADLFTFNAFIERFAGAPAPNFVRACSEG